MFFLSVTDQHHNGIRCLPNGASDDASLPAISGPCLEYWRSFPIIVHGARLQ